MSGWRRRANAEPDTGSATVFLTLTVTGLLVVAGLVVDGAAKVRALQRADTLAGEAARAGGQAIDRPHSITGQPPRADPRAAAHAAQTYLAAAGLTGTVRVEPTGRRLTVAVTTTEDTAFLGLIGIHTVTVAGQATVDLVPGISGAAP